MNKQEFIERMKSLKNIFGNKSEYIKIDAVIELASELDEPQKPVVPQFVADWIEEGKKHCKDVSDLFDFDFTNEDVGNWFLQEKPFDLVARAWLDGYTVEKEKPALMNDIMAPILNYKNKIIDTEQQNIVNSFIGGAR
ncbi:DUF1642 domain-containing protein [Streptococcus sp. HMSC072C09]|jgi:phage protein|uniref:DUF1642 domain-containing protein n=1 Tax=Streptococcus sp. HMSC072C09 TaxID=1739397 RepID=UPI0008A57891|nr:DUF1642 domain-containing protein [Streptococcus sp. HMSC072C09]OFR31035.1 hypothetical protein HMPREF2893_01375 [Streptococcus sp. HMSC072C09]DAM42765.1 MAG TPA: Protein of unknown function (DUF1642) [Caudoviricetes sp.]